MVQKLKRGRNNRKQRLAIKSNSGIRGSMFGEIADQSGKRRNIAKGRRAAWNGRRFKLAGLPKPKAEKPAPTQPNEGGRPIGLSRSGGKGWRRQSGKQFKDNNRPQYLRLTEIAGGVMDAKTGDIGRIEGFSPKGKAIVRIVERGSKGSPRKLDDVVLWEL